MLNRDTEAEHALLVLFGRSVRDARERCGWSQRELCRRTQFDQSWISSVENGNANIGLRAIGKLARVLGVDPADFLRPGAFATSPRPLDREPEKKR